MIYFLRETYPDVFERITGDFTHGDGDSAVVHPFGNLARYSGEELAALGIHAVPLVEPDMGMRIATSAFQRVEGRVVNVVTQEPLPIVVPASVTNAQAKIALHRAGLLPAVTAAINGGDIEAVIWFANAQTWERDNSNVVALGAQLGLTGEQIDALFVSAAQVR